MRVLCLSNGHGEDAIALRILRELQQQPTPPDLTALPIVGEGYAYTNSGIPLIGSVKAMPSGGFIYQDGRQLARDIRGGLLQLTLAQLRAIRAWATTIETQRRRVTTSHSPLPTPSFLQSATSCHFSLPASVDFPTPSWAPQSLNTTCAMRMAGCPVLPGGTIASNAGQAVSFNRGSAG